jgi:hypothetical protein
LYPNLIYLRANLTTKRRITKLAYARRRKEQNIYKQTKKQGSLYSNNNSINFNCWLLSLKLNNPEARRQNNNKFTKYNISLLRQQQQQQ